VGVVICNIIAELVVLTAYLNPRALYERPSMRGIERTHGACRHTVSAWS